MVDALIRVACRHPAACLIRALSSPFLHPSQGFPRVKKKVKIEEKIGLGRGIAEIKKKKKLHAKKGTREASGIYALVISLSGRAAAAK